MKIRDPVPPRPEGQKKFPRKRDDTIYVRINSDVKVKLLREAKRLDHSVSTVINHLVVEWLHLPHDV